MQRFKLSEKFIEEYKTRQPDWGALGEFVFYRTYSRRIEEENRNESWWETVRRVVEGTFSIQKDHCATLRLPWNGMKGQHSAQIMYEKIFSFKFVPPGRGLWMMGTPFIYERGGMALNSCAFVSTEGIKYRGVSVFLFTMDALMNGVGVGFDTKGAGQVTIKTPKSFGEKVFVIEDSREGWIDATGAILKGFFNGDDIPSLDYSLIRLYGARIKGFGGVASGKKPLMILHDTLTRYLENCMGDELTSTMIVDIMNMIGKCVVAGNVRRSAQLAIGAVDDKEYRTLKDPEKHHQELMDWRWVSNNSVFVTVGMDYSEIVDSIVKNVDLGLVWLDNIQNLGRIIDNGEGKKDLLARGVNACAEQALEDRELCTLVETFPSRHETYEEFEETLKSAYLYAKTVTLVPTHWPETNQVMMKNRRIGTSQSGIIDAFVKHGRREMLRWSDKGYRYLKTLDQIYSDWLCIPRSIKITSVKPSGTVSLLPGVSPGIHYPHSEYYIRRIRLAKGSPLLPIVRSAGYHIEQDLYQSGTDVVSFPVHEQFFSRRKEDVSVWEQVVNAVDYQTYWSDNNVSITVTFKPEEQKDVVRVLEAFEDRLKAVSFLPLSGHGYAQAPYEEITESEFKSMTKHIKDIDFTGLVIEPEGSKYCDGDACEIGGVR